jgi:Kef-type K+ transport system membrane component KefB
VSVSSVEMTLLLLLVAILIGPMLAERVRVPGMLGLIFLGMVFGPFVLGWVRRGGLVSDLGQVGILYLMFLAGLGFNLRAFGADKKSAIVFGLASFVVPFGLSVTVASTLGYAPLAAALIGSMWASNTLVAYPDVRAAGLQDTRAVRDAVSAGVVADLLSLLVLAVTTTRVVIEVVEEGETVAEASTVPLIITVPLLVGFALWLLPRLGRWFFVRVGRSRAQRFVFALAGMALSATLAVAAGVEGIIGAFLAGLGLNRLVPDNSELMDRLDFVGATLFVPAFLVSVGLSIDPSAFFELDTVGLGILFTGFVVVGKTGAALFASAISGYTRDEIGLMSSLSFGQAASTLAIAQVGLALGLFDQQVVNASVIAIVLTALLTSYGTRYFLQRIPAPPVSSGSVGARVLVDVRESWSRLDQLVRFSGAVARGDDGIVVPFTTPPSGSKERGRARIAEAEQVAAAAGHDTEGIVRISDEFADGALELVEEVDASLIVMSWAGPKLGPDRLMGSEIDAVGQSCPVPAAAVHLLRPWRRVLLLVGDASVAWRAEDARLAATIAGRLRRRDGELLVAGTGTDVLGEVLGDPRYVTHLEPLGVRGLLERLQPDDLVIAPAYAVNQIGPAERFRLAVGLADANLAVIAGASRLSVTPNAAPGRMEQIIGPRSEHARPEASARG